MGYINYFSGIVKVLEKPNQFFLNNTKVLTKVRAEVSQSRNKQFITLHFWGNLGRDLKIYYQPQDYILIEGYLSIPDKLNSSSNSINSKSTILTVLKVYPLVLTETENLFKV